MTILYRILLLSLLFSACKKKQQPEPKNEPVNPPGGVTPAPDPDCGTIPPPPTGFQWIDSVVARDKRISAFLYNPLNAQEVLVVTEGDFTGGNDLLNVNLVSKSVKLIAQIDTYLPSVNNQGWILFSSVDKNIFKIKTNGDSLTKLINTNAAVDPKWDHTGKNFYYFQDAFSTVPAQLIRATAKGEPIINWPHQLHFTAPFHKSNKVVVMRNVGDVVTVYLQDFDLPAEKTLFSGPFNGDVHFRYLCVDANDERLYWSNNTGIFSYHLESKKTDTLFKNCETVEYAKPIASQANEITYSKHLKKTAHPYWLVHSYKAMEYNTALKENREINVFQ